MAELDSRCREAMQTLDPADREDMIARVVAQQKRILARGERVQNINKLFMVRSLSLASNFCTA